MHALVTAVISLGLAGGVSSGQEVSALKNAVKIEMVEDGDSLEEKFRLLKDLGFDGVELSSPNAWSQDEVVAARDAVGLPIHGVVCSEHWKSPLNHPDPEVRAKCVAAIETAIDDARAYGANTVLVVPAVVNKGMSYGDAWRLSREGIARVLPAAEAAGVTIAFENVWNNFLLSPREAAAYVDSFQSEHVGWYLDIGNLIAYGWPEHWIEVLGPRIVKVDVKEYSRQKLNQEGRWAGFSVELLEGDCDWPTVVKALAREGYDGWMTAEIAGGDRARLTQIAENMNRIRSGES